MRGTWWAANSGPVLGGWNPFDLIFVTLRKNERGWVTIFDPVGASIAMTQVRRTGKRRDVVKKYRFTGPCRKGAAGLTTALRSNFSQFANLSRPESYLRFLGGSIEPGKKIPIQHDLGLPFSEFTSAVTVSSVTPTSFAFETVEGEHPFYPGTITFTSTDVWQGMASFEIDVNSNFANRFYELAYQFGGSEFEEEVWQNLLSNIADACG